MQLRHVSNLFLAKTSSCDQTQEQYHHGAEHHKKVLSSGNRIYFQFLHQLISANGILYFEYPHDESEYFHHQFQLRSIPHHRPLSGFFQDPALRIFPNHLYPAW